MLDSITIQGIKRCKSLPDNVRMTSKRRDGEEEDVVLVGRYSETDNSSMLVSDVLVLFTTVAPRAVVRDCRCA